MKLFDSHCHLDDGAYDQDIDAVVMRAREAGVAAAMIAGVDLESSSKAVRLAQKYPGLFAAVGVHPHDARHCCPDVLRDLQSLAADTHVRAWGEIGLDFNRMYSPRMDQEHWFLQQLEAADELRLPVIFHERESGGRLLDILEADGNRERRGVIHCFSGTGAELESYLDLGLFVGVTGILTLKQRGAALRRQVRRIPAARLVVETDAPYLTPAPEKNHFRRNEPAFVKSVLLRLAAVRNEDPEVLAETIWNNTCRLYGIAPGHDGAISMGPKRR